MHFIHYLLFIALFVVVMSCGGRRDVSGEHAGKAPVRLMTLAPGHFHAALVQKDMYPQVDSTVWVYAPEGPELSDHLTRIRRYNERDLNPTSWNQQVFVGDDFLERMLAERPGNVAVISGNNARKTDYIHRTVSAGIHVLADKPMAIDPEGFELLRQAFEVAAEQNVLLYDIMTERYEITSILQKEFSRFPEVFGALLNGSPEEPAVVKESVHHFYKQVSGAPLVRPAWFFDVRQQGEGVVDVTTHLVDLIQWACFPEEIIDYATDIELIAARRWATDLMPAQFARVTQLDAYPDFLQGDIVRDSILQVYSNGEIRYKLRGVHALVSVTWAYEAPPGAGDTHYSIMRGSRSNLVIRQGAEQAYQPTLYIEPAHGVTTADLDPAMQEAMSRLGAAYPGLGLENLQNGWKVLIPESYKVGHEAHFAEVTERFLQYLEEGSLPSWEVPNMLAKYYTTTRAFALSR